MAKTPVILLTTLLAASHGLATIITPRHEPTRTKLSYGNHTVPSRKHDNGMMMFEAKAIAPPCTDCAVTFMQAHLEYTHDGSRADADTGMWMHHVVFQNLGRRDGVCGELGIGERFFASGNERSAVDFAESQEEDGDGDVGYFFDEGDEMRVFGELMNLREGEREVELSVTWGFVETHAKEMRPVTPYWLDIGGCAGSDRPAANESYFSYSSPVVTSDFDGRAVFVAGHLHDGGEKLEVLRNGEPMCMSVPKYTDGHISDMPSCVDAGEIREGDEWRVKGHYDTYKYQPMVNQDGSLEPIMGIALAYVLKGDAAAGSKGRGHGWTVFFFVLIALVVLGGVGYVMWNRRRVAVWPKWASGRAREGRYGALDGSGNGAGEGEALAGDEEEDEENVWARQTRGSVRLPGGNTRL